MTSSGDGKVTRKVLIIDLSDYENRKQDISEQLHFAASEVGFVSTSDRNSPSTKA